MKNLNLLEEAGYITIKEDVRTFITKTFSPSEIWKNILPILYSGVLSSGIAYTFEIVAPKNIPPMAASFIMSLESVINVFASIVLLGETLAGREALGSIIMFVAIILAQLPAKEKDKPWQHKE